MLFQKILNKFYTILPEERGEFRHQRLSGIYPLRAEHFFSVPDKIHGRIPLIVAQRFHQFVHVLLRHAADFQPQRLFFFFLGGSFRGFARSCVFRMRRLFLFVDAELGHPVHDDRGRFFPR